MNKKLWLLSLVASIITLQSLAQTFKFLPDRFSQSKSGLEIKAITSVAWPLSLTPTQDPKWTDLVAHPSPSSRDYDYKSVQDMVRISVNRDIANIVAAFSYQVTLSIELYDYAAPTSPTTITKTLYLSYDPNVRELYNDMSVYKFSGYHKFKVSIIDVQQLPTAVPGSVITPVAASDIASNFFIESEISLQRYDFTLPTFLTESYVSADKRNLHVSEAPSGFFLPTTQVKPLAYELEWTYIEDYQYDITSNTQSFKYPSTSTLTYDFRKNSTRVQLDYPSFDIPLIYEHGAIVYRFRTLRPNRYNYKELIYGNWTLPDNGTTSVTASDFNTKGYIIADPHTHDSLNWQYTINFAEQGKYKHVINYFDGSLKDRQTQTKINSNPNYVVAVDKVYDYEGRPSIVSLPTPVQQQYLYFRSDILTNNATSLPYKAADFDMLGCTRPAAIDPLAATAAAHKYYSPDNPDKSGMQKFVPDAEKFPLVQTVYSPDNTNKVSWQGGAGKEQQISKGHATQYEYVRANQLEIDKLLGSEAGYNAYYPKQIVTDPNGQSSYSILNPQGKVIISGLQGASPDPDKHPITQLDNFVTGETVCTDLLKNEQQEQLPNGLSSSAIIYNDAKSATNTLEYSVITKPFPTECSGQYLWAKGYYDIKVADDCGTLDANLSTSGTVGDYATTATIGAGESKFTTTPALSTTTLPKGKIFVDRKLTFSPYDIRNQVSNFVKTNEPSCYNDENYFVRTAVENAKFPCTPETGTSDKSPCDILRAQMRQQMYPDARYGQYLKNDDGSFNDEKKNSIFTITIKDIPLSTSGAASEKYAYKNGVTEPCEIKGCGTKSSTWCPDGTPPGCGCAPGAHPYTSPCCSECLINHCSCIVFKVKELTTVTTTTVTKTLPCKIDYATKFIDISPITGAYVISYSSDAPPPAGSTGVFAQFQTYTTKATCNCSETHILNVNVQKRFPYRASPYNDWFCAINEDKVFIPTTCAQPVEVPTGTITTFVPGIEIKYRYQSDCINYPAEVWHNGKKYTNIASLDPQTFIDIFNDDIAEALLPLHPEYCKLLNCEATTGDFENKFESLETYQQAEAAGLFKLADIVATDPLAVYLAGGTSSSSYPSYKNILKYPFNVTSATTGYPPPSGTLALDQQAITNVYCAAGNNEEMTLCAATKYATEIANAISSTPTFISAELKQKYFETLKALYIANRSLTKQYMLDYYNRLHDCPSCQTVRLDLIEPTVFKGLYKYSEYTTGGLKVDFDKGAEYMPEWKKAMYKAAFEGKPFTGIPSEMTDENNQQREEFASIEAESITNALKNCGISDADLLTIGHNLTLSIAAGNKITPAMIKDIIIERLGTSGLTDLCHPFLVAYGLYPSPQPSISNYACADAALYTDLQYFLNRYEVRDEILAASTSPRSGTAITLSSSATTHPFEAALSSAAGATGTYVLAKPMTVPGCSSCHYIQLQVGSSTNYINIQAQDMATTADVQTFANSLATPSTLSFANVQCLNDDKRANTFGAIAQKTAVIQATCPACSTLTSPAKYYVWTNNIDLMTAVPDASALANAITCIDLKAAIADFKASDKSTYAYTDNTNHPLYQLTITNYLNYKFNKKFKYQDYLKLMEGCAITDQAELPKYAATIRLEYSSETDVNNCINTLNAYDQFQPAIFRYKESSGGNHILFIDLNSVAQDKLKAYKDLINSTSIPSPVSRTAAYSFPSADNVIFTKPSCAFSAAAIPSSLSATYSSSTAYVYENGAYVEYKMHKFHLPTSATAKDKADLQATVNNYLHGSGSTSGGDICNATYAFWTNEHYRSPDYASPLKQQYLSYIYSCGLTGGALITEIAPSKIATHLTSPFNTGYTFTYDDPYCIGNRTHLYAYIPNPATIPSGSGYDILKNIMIPSIVGSAGTTTPFPNARITTGTAPSSGGLLIPKASLKIIRKANGDYWYRYFDAADKLYSAYITPPSKNLGKDLNTYKLTAISMGAHPNTFVAELTSGTGASATVVKCHGYTSFPLATTYTATNLILQNDPKGLQPFDSLDCESNMLVEATRNGKAAYYQYFQATVAKMSNDMMNHLIANTKETLTYCGQQQQYQQTLYYYDRVGNLTRTVPPQGATPLGTTGYTPITGGHVFGTNEVATYRDNPDQLSADYPTIANPNLTEHRKVSYYQYNSLNQLVYQKTPDGGITYFFYDAAGRQIFSQNSKQRKDGYYTYSIYDEQGRPEESGEVQLGCKYTSTVDYDLTPCTVFYKRPDLSDASSTGPHPDFISYSHDEHTYPYDDLKFYIRNKARRQVVRTHYDNPTQDLGAIPDAMLSTQENLRSRVAAIKYYAALAPAWAYTSSPLGDADFSTYYSYDISGNVQNITYDYPKLLTYDARYTRLDYDYDLISGKVNMISYNRGHPDQFYQQYDYDADNRITTVRTSNDGLVWNTDAQYSYYLHGPLATLKVGNQKIQSLEYAYTIQGWLKAINGDLLNPSKEMGQNGTSGDVTYPQDVLAHALRYFDNDYKPIGSTPVISLPLSGGVGGAGGGAVPNLYNGNITHQTTGIAGHGTMLRTYNYDQLQRLKLATNTNVDDAALSTITTPADLFKTGYSYDMDGNITNLERWDGQSTPIQIDNFSYKYDGPSATATTNNKLLQVADAAAPTSPPLGGLGGVDLQPGQPTDNYAYDKTGNLIQDKQADLSILWNRFGKVTDIKNATAHTTLSFAYDGKGNRIWKNHVHPPITGGGTEEHEGEYYVRDAGGNILSVYRTHSKFNRRLTFEALTPMLSTGATGTLADVLVALKDRSISTALLARISTAHSTWLSSYTDRPISYFLDADPTLKSNLLYSGDAWINALRTASTPTIREAFLHEGLGNIPLWRATLDYGSTATALLSHFSQHMPQAASQSLWNLAQVHFDSGAHAANATALYTAVAADNSLMPIVSEGIAAALLQNFEEAGTESAAFTDAVITDNALWLSSSLRDNNGPWTQGIRATINHSGRPTDLATFFDGWTGAAAALTACTAPDYRINTVFAKDPALALRDFTAEASHAELIDILTDAPDVPTAEFGEIMMDIASLGSPEINAALRMGTSGDTLNLAEHHIYGSSRLGVQRYNNLLTTTLPATIISSTMGDNPWFIGNILRPVTGSPVHNLNRQYPWYSYAFDDIIKADAREPYGTGISGNTHLAEWYISRTLGRRYYEMTDHLGNVLATVLDRKTGAGTSGTGLYDHWSADLASTADYYPGGMMMPGRNTEYSWSRMGYNKSSAKDDEISGKGNHFTTFFREGDTRLLTWWGIDPKPNSSLSAYNFMNGNYIWFNDPMGDIANVDGSKREKKQFINMLNRTTGNKYGIDKDGNLFNKGGTTNTVTDKNKSGELSALVGKTIASNEVIKISLTNNDNNVAFDRFDDAKLDLGDFKKAPIEFQAGMLGHVFAERLNTPGGYSDVANRNDAGYNVGHQQGLLTESSIITSMRGTPFALRNISPAQGNRISISNPDGTTTLQTVSFKEVWSYGSVQFNMFTGVQRTPLNDGTGRSIANQAIGDILQISKK